MTKASAYLDYNATAPIRPEVVRIMAATLAEVGNPSSVHRAGRSARRLIENAREQIARLVGAAPDGVSFTSGGTEANNQALVNAKGAGGLWASAIEHDSVRALVREEDVLPVDHKGVIDLEALRSRLDQACPALISVMLANNETGVIQPVAALARMARERGALVHCDAVQAAGKLPVRVSDLDVDFLTLSAHKFGGPQGVGALVTRPGLTPEPLLFGGAQEQRRRAGTENVAGIVGFGKAAELALDDVTFEHRVGGLRDRLERAIRAAAPDTPIFGAGAARLPTTSCLAMPGVANQTQLMAFDLDGLALSAGAACSSGKVGPSHVLAAMAVPPVLASQAIRVSLGWASTEDDVDRLVQAWSKLRERTAPASVDMPKQAAALAFDGFDPT